MQGRKRRDAHPSPVESAVRHLLRHLGDPTELRRNALAAPFFEVGARCDPIADVLPAIVSWVRRGVDMLGAVGDARGAQRRDLIVQCDLEGVPHKAVMARLGISSRTFYYERRAALQMLALVLAREAPQIPARSSEFDEFEARLRGAFAVHNAGHTAMAIQTLRQLAETTKTAQSATRANAAIARLCADTGAYREAREALREASIAAAQLVWNSSVPEAVALAELGLAAATVRWHAGESAAFADLEDLLARIRTSAFLSVEALREVHVRAAIVLSGYAFVNGSIDASVRLIEEARASLERMRDAPADLRTLLLLAQGDVALMLDRPIADSERVNAEALAIAQRHGYLYYVIAANSGICVVEAMRGRHRRAAAAGRATASLGQGIVSFHELSFLQLNTARSEMLAGNVAEAATLVDGVCGRAANSSGILSAFGETLRVALLNASGRYGPAATLSRSVIGRLEHLGANQFLSTAHRFRAEALHQLGRRREAADAIEAAVALSERHSTRHAVAEAYELAATVTGDARRAARARELRTVLLGRTE